MIIDSFTSKDFYRQSGRCSVSMDLVFSSYDRIDLGLSGDNAVFFQFISGKMYDPNFALIHSYSINKPLSLSGNFSSGKYDLYIDGTPVSIGQPCPASWVSRLFINPFDSEIDFSYSINGDIPNYSVTSEFIFNTGETVLTGNFVNDSLYPIELYSGDFGTENASFSGSLARQTVLAGQTGRYYLYPNGASSVGPHTIKPTFYTNFGNLPMSIDASGVENILANYQISLSGPNEVDEGFTYQYYVEFSVVDGDMSVVPMLKHVAGSGIQQVNIDLYAPYSGVGSGYITESGFLYKYFSLVGTGQGGINDILGSGDVSGSGSGFQWATGNFSTSVTYDVTGYGTGVGYSGLSVGQITETVSGTILDGSGRYVFNISRTGTPLSAVSLYPAYHFPATGKIFYNTPSSTPSPDILYVNSLFHGIVYGFHYNTAAELAGYLNANTGTHGVSATLVGSDIALSSIITGPTANNIFLSADESNAGTTAMSGPYMSGGYSSGYNTPVVPISGFTGHLSHTYVNSGNYSKNISGHLQGVGSVNDETKYFNLMWDMVTGDALGVTYSYRDHDNYHHNSGFYKPSGVMDSRGAFLIQITYDSPYNATGDIAKLIVSGLGGASGVYQEILITGIRN